MTRGELGECPDCGLLQRLPSLAAGYEAHCGRCESLLRQQRKHAVWFRVGAAFAGAALFGLALWLPVASVRLPGGRVATATLFTAVEQLERGSAPAVWLLAAATLLVVPLLKLAPVGALSLLSARGTVPSWLKALVRLTQAARDWSMVEVFMLGALIALFRLRGWMVVDFGLALFALAGVALCSLGIDAAARPRELWSTVPSRPGADELTGPLVACSSCGLVGRQPAGARCARCEAILHPRKVDSVRNTWALLAAATLLTLPANLLPVLSFSQMGQGGPSTIIGGCGELIERGLWPLAAIVFVASIVVPLAKIGTLSLLMLLMHRARPDHLRLRTQAFRVVAAIGRWSMLDVFATATLAGLARFGWLGSVRPEPGLSAFAGAVVLTMLAASTFDPRLMWDAAGANPAIPEGAIR